MPKLGCSPVMILGVLVLLVLLSVSLVSGAIGSTLLGDKAPSFFSVPDPHIKLPADEIFNLFGFHITNTMIASWVTIIVAVGLFYAATRKMKLVPRGLQNLVEFAVEALLNFVEGVAGKENGRRFFPISRSWMGQSKLPNTNRKSALSSSAPRLKLPLSRVVILTGKP